MRSVARVFCLGAVSLLFAACSNLGADQSTQTQTRAPAGPVVARLDGVPIHQRELDQWLKDDWLEAIAEDPTKVYELRRAGVEGVIDDALINRAAADSALSPDDYMDRETKALGPVTDEEIDEFYARYKDRIRPADSLEQLRPQIRTFMEEDRPIRVVTGLREAAEIEILLAPPPTPQVVRHDIPEGGASRGPADAPVTIVEFSDYQCPFCERVEDTLHELDRLYPNVLRFVYRHFPLDIHHDALPAAKAAVCADEQSRFWDYHNLLFANQRALSTGHLLQYAAGLGLDEARFRVCLEAATTEQRVTNDMAIARAAGATATPTFFINGILLRGARELAAFRTIIDRELAQQQAGK